MAYPQPRFPGLLIPLPGVGDIVSLEENARVFA